MKTRPLQLLLLWGPLLGACAAPGPVPVTAPAIEQASPEAAGTTPEAAPAQAGLQVAELDTKWPPGPAEGDQSDWICLVSGEWLRGEFISLNRGSVEFESDELDTLNLDWDDIHELVTNRTFTALLADRTSLVGQLRVTRKRLYLTNAAGEFEYPRAQLMRVIPGRPEGRAFWTGRIALNATARTGNTEQTDVGLAVDTKRRTADSRTTLSLSTLVSTTDDSQTANNRALSGRHDVYLSPKFFITPLGFELYQDRFQNLDLRATPSTGLGYTFVDRNTLELDGTASIGYRYTRYDSVAAGEDDSDGTGTLILGTELDADLTPKVELGFDYTVQLGLERIEDTNQEAALTLSLDFLWDLELDVSLSWKHVGAPEPDANNITPEKDDFRLDVGFALEF